MKTINSKKNKKVKKLVLLNFEDIFDSTKVLTNHVPVTKEKTFTEGGVFSEEIFGEMSGDDIDTIGWITIEKGHIINPIMFNHLKRLLGKDLDRIIKYEKSIDKDGNIVEDEEEDQNLGLLGFKDNFVALVEKYGNKKKYEKEYNFVLQNMEHVFINKIPVFNSKLRPASMIANTMVYDEINAEYNMILKYLHESDQLEDDHLTLPLLYNIQNYAVKIWNNIIADYLRGKKGFLRKSNLGSRINFSSRNVITPLIGRNIDEVAIPYVVFAELYKYHLIALMSESKGIDYIEALDIWREKSLKFDEELYKYMMLLMERSEGGLNILLNRNPSISVGSILYLKIGEIKKDFSDVTLSISNNLLASLAGDFDGDVLNIIPILDINMQMMFSILSPSSLLIDRNNGKFNRRFGLEKDQILGIHILNN